MKDAHSLSQAAQQLGALKVRLGQEAAGSAHREGRPAQPTNQHAAEHDGATLISAARPSHFSGAVEDIAAGVRIVPHRLRQYTKLCD